MYTYTMASYTAWFYKWVDNRGDSWFFDNTEVPRPELISRVLQRGFPVVVRRYRGLYEKSRTVP